MLPEILRLQQQGKSLSEIGRLLGFTHQAIGRAVCGKIIADGRSRGVASDIELGYAVPEGVHLGKIG